MTPEELKEVQCNPVKYFEDLLDDAKSGEWNYFDMSDTQREFIRAVIDGEKVYVLKTGRQFSNAEMVRRLEKFITEVGE